MSRGARAASLAALGLAAAACSYDVTRLGPRDGGGSDVVGFDAADNGAADVPPRVDGADVQVAPDVAPGTCSNPHVVAAAGHTFGPSLVINGSTAGGDSLLNAPTDSAGCQLDYAANPSPEEVFRYTMTGTSGRLLATTDAPSCDTSFDTIVYLRTTCDPGTGDVLACDDDDHVLGACMCPAIGACPGLESSAVATGLAQGQDVYVVVDGFNMTTGSFQLTLTEGAAQDTVPPLEGSGLSIVDRCACPSGSDLLTRDAIDFPTGSDRFGGSATSLATTGDTFSGTHTTVLTHASGVALDVTLAQNGLTRTGCPAGATATVDVLINAHVVQSFLVTADTPAPTPLRVAYQTFGALTLGTHSIVVALRLRAITAGCGGLVFANGGSSTILLVGNAT